MTPVEAEALHLRWAKRQAVLVRIAHLRRLPVWRRRQLTISRRLSRG